MTEKAVSGTNPVSRWNREKPGLELCGILNRMEGIPTTNLYTMSTHTGCRRTNDLSLLIATGEFNVKQALCVSLSSRDDLTRGVHVLDERKSRSETLPEDYELKTNTRSL